MATITHKKALFFFASPRSPLKMIEEIRLLVTLFEGKTWDVNTQTAFGEHLSKADFYEGRITSNLDFAARDRITRGPKALGFVELTPKIRLTEAGTVLLSSKRPHEIFTKQLLKFQLPSPYHVDKAGHYLVKPYLELFRLVRDLNGLTKDEIGIFFMQLIHIDEYDRVRKKIQRFRKELKNLDRKKTSYKRFCHMVWAKELEKLFAQPIEAGKIRIRESGASSLSNFIQTKRRNHKDYADAVIRYLRATNLVSIKPRSYHVFIPEERRKDVDYILRSVKRQPDSFEGRDHFKKYLFSATNTQLFSDDKRLIVKTVLAGGGDLTKKDLKGKSLEELKDMAEALIKTKKARKVEQEVASLKTYEEFQDIVLTYENIKDRTIIDPSLMFEWNTWRAFVILDEGSVKGNFRRDGNGMPLHHAPPNFPDIECAYSDFDVIVEVTLATGVKQYEMEGEPVSRHLGRHQECSGKPTYCIFVAPNVNKATWAYFFTLHRTPISYYGGISKIIPLELAHFLVMMDVARQAETRPSELSIKKFVEYASSLALTCEDEMKWSEEISRFVYEWI